MNHSPLQACLKLGVANGLGQTLPITFRCGASRGMEEIAHSGEDEERQLNGNTNSLGMDTDVGLMITCRGFSLICKNEFHFR